jgi:cbb3-type cytochrome oxidase subunit 3
VYTEYFRRSDWLHLAEYASIFFAVFFTAVVIWVLTDRSGTFQAAARLPLEDDTGPGLPSASPEKSESQP